MDFALSNAARNAEPIDPTAETVINGAPYVPGEGFRSRREPGAELKRRLMAAAELYLAAQRDTVGG
jgi:hypothetical protein